jgi:hypothetical protein
MKYIKTFENYGQVNEFLRKDKAKITLFVRDLIRKVKNSQVVSEIQDIVNMMVIDPYATYNEVISYIYSKYNQYPEVLSVIEPYVDKEHLSSTIRENKK